MGQGEQNMLPYQYEPLSEGNHEVRVIRLLPGQGTEDLRCLIQHVNLRQGIEYDTLSYAWRDDYLFDENQHAVPERIICEDDTFIPIGSNLASFLRHYRKPTEAAPAIWIDSICINQNDIAERSHQVSRMYDIYRCARSVIVWLGPAKDNSDVALRFISLESSRGQLSNDNLMPSEQQSFAWWDAAYLSQVQDEAGQDDGKIAWQAVLDLFQRSWWRRTWVVQEACVAERILFVVGTQALDTSSLWTLLENLWLHSKVRRPTKTCVQSFERVTYAKAVDRSTYSERPRFDQAFIDRQNNPLAAPEDDSLDSPPSSVSSKTNAGDRPKGQDLRITGDGLGR
jgi:hypothetical protein